MDSKDLRKKYNSQRSTLFVAVIHVPYDNSLWFPDLDNLDFYFKNYACILHDMDNIDNLDYSIPLDYNLPVPKKPLHYHFVLELSSRSYSSSVNKLLCSIYNLPSNCVSVEKCSSLNMSLRYLIHIDDKDKYQYSFDKIRTSNYIWLLSNFNQSEKALEDFVYDSLVKCKGDYNSLLCTIGFKLAKQYYQIINQYFRVYYSKFK